MIKIIAEIGCNHNGDASLAVEMMDAAKKCGADAVKFQTFDAESLVSVHAEKAEYQKETTGKSESQRDMIKKLELKNEDYLMLCRHAKETGIEIFSTPFDIKSIDFLQSAGQTVWKIPSGEITNLPYLKKIGALKCSDKKIILSTGMAEISEIEQCLDVLEKSGAKKHEITILHCNTEYPTPDKDVNLLAINDLKAHFKGYGYGFSDHSTGYTAAVAASALGISVIEKHFTLDKNMPGPDHKASASPEEFKALCENVRRVESMLGAGIKKVTESERKNKVIARKSIIAAVKIKKGDIFTPENVTCKRPGNGISPMKWDEVLGKKAARDFEADELIECPGIENQ